MEDKWTVKKIGDLGRIVTGKTPSTKVSEYFGGAYPFITIPDLDGRREISESERTLSSLGAEHLHSYILPPGAVMMSCIATIGKCGITTRSSFTNQQINSVICNKDVHPEFLYYSFARLVPSLEAAGGGGSVYTNVSKSRFSDLEISLPPLNEQHAIAHILGTLDDKIELNRRMNETLEGMARALFKSWFVDFDPVRAKSESRDTGLPSEISDLFPDEFVDSELGEIPKGWEVSTLGSVSEHPRRSIKPDEIPQGTPYIALEHMPKKCIALSSWGIADELESNKYQFNRGEILFGKLRPYFHKVGVAPLDGVCSTDIVVISPKKDLWHAFVLGHASSDVFVEHTNASSTGTRMPRTNWNDMSAFKVILPPEQLAERLTAMTSPFIRKIIDNIHQSLTLSSLRDTLLPKLISGEIRVEAAEKFLEVVET